MTRRTNPNANADNHGYFGGAVPKRFQRVDGHVTAVSTHGGQGYAGGLHCYLTGEDNITPCITCKLSVLNINDKTWRER